MFGFADDPRRIWILVASTYATARSLGCIGTRSRHDRSDTLERDRKGVTGRG